MENPIYKWINDWFMVENPIYKWMNDWFMVENPIYKWMNDWFMMENPIYKWMNDCYIMENPIYKWMNDWFMMENPIYKWMMMDDLGLPAWNGNLHLDHVNSSGINIGYATHIDSNARLYSLVFLRGCIRYDDIIPVGCVNPSEKY